MCENSFCRSLQLGKSAVINKIYRTILQLLLQIAYILAAAVCK